MNKEGEEVYSEKLMTLAKTEDYNSIRLLLDKHEIDYIFKSKLKPEWPGQVVMENQTTFFVKPDDIAQASEICKVIISVVNRNKRPGYRSSKSLLDRLIEKIKKRK